MARVQGTAIQREMVPVVQYLLLYGLKTLFGIESMNALPALLFSDEALMRLVGFNAQHVRHGVCQHGAANRQGLRPEGTIGPEAPATPLVQLNLRDLEAWSNGTMRALAQAGVFGAWDHTVATLARTDGRESRDTHLRNTRAPRAPASELC